MLQMYKVYLKENAFSTRSLFRKMLILEQRLNSSNIETSKYAHAAYSLPYQTTQQKRIASYLTTRC